MDLDAWLGRTLQGRYRLTSLLGEGGMGAVFRAIQEPLGREVAVKILQAQLDHETARERFGREARALARLHHPHIVVLHDFGEAEGGALFLVMEEVQGRGLRDLMQERGALSWGRAARIAHQIARGLRAAHAEGVVHADLKPENVMLHRPPGEDEQVKILDFGLARLVQADGQPALTQAGIIVGTPRYLSPEQIQGVRTDPRSDLYALGVMLFEMLVGKPPFEAPAAAMVLVQHLSQAPRAPSADGVELPAALDALVLELLQKEPESRPKDADEVVHRLEALLADGLAPPREPAATGGAAGAPAVQRSAELSWPPVASGAPVGRVTLVFTDIESSSSLWDAVPATMRDGLRVHDEVLRRTLATWGGYEVKTQGDSFMVTFSAPADALRWCLDVQDELLKAPWPGALLEREEGREIHGDDGQLLFKGLRVRMGVFEGEPDCRPDPVTGRMDYFGPVVNRAARIEAAAHGGQVLVGGHLAHVAESLLAGQAVHTEDLGDHGLKGIGGKERLKDVRRAHLQGRTFPAPRTLSSGADDVVQTNLGPDSSEFLGREGDLVRVAEAFRHGPIVTLLGPGGTGKTRLSRRYGEQLVERKEVAGGVWFVDLTEATTAGGVVTATADAVGLQQLGGSTVEETVEVVGKFLAAKGPSLLIFDNFEQVVDHAAETVGRWREHVPEARFLVTSRIPLQVEGEQALELDPLDEDLGVELFLARANVTLPPEDLDAVRQIVRALDGLPLAIELAAARARVLSPQKILERLGSRLDFLKEGRRDRTSRQNHLRGAIDWSWDLLTPEERSAFARCGAFAGGFTLEAAEEILGAPGHGADVLDLVQSLKEKSLLRTVKTADGELRFTMFASIQAYAEEKLGELDDAEATWHRHADYYLEHGERHAEAAKGPRAPESLAWLAAERENLLKVEERFAESEPAKAARTLLALERLIESKGPFVGRLQLLRRAQAAAERAPGTLLLARTLLRRGRFHALESDAERGREDLEETVKLAQRGGYDGLTLEAYAFLIRTAVRKGDLPRVDDYVRRAEGIDRERYPRSQALFTLALGMAAIAQGHVDEARKNGRTALALARKVGDRNLEGRILSNFGIMGVLTGDVQGAISSYRQALDVVNGLGDRGLEGMVMGNLGTAHGSLGDLAKARRFLEEALAIHAEVGNAMLEAADGMNLALIDLVEGHLDAAEAAIEAARRYFLTREGSLRELTIASTGLLYVYAGRGELEKARREFAALIERSSQYSGRAFFVHDAVRLVTGRMSALEAAVAPDPAQRQAWLEKAEEAYRAVAHSPVYFLHGFVKCLRQALLDEGVDLSDELVLRAS